MEIDDFRDLSTSEWQQRKSIAAAKRGIRFYGGLGLGEVGVRLDERKFALKKIPKGEPRMPVQQ